MIDYTIFYKDRFRADELTHAGEWDLLLSAYDETTRCDVMFKNAKAEKKVCWALPEYGFSQAEVPTAVSRIGREADADEMELVASHLRELGDLSNLRLCIDISGFISHYVLVLLRVLYDLGVKRFDVVYAEPVRYTAKEQTKFSDETVLEVRQLAGYEGVHGTNTTRDLLVIAVGYDHRLVSEVASQKEHAKKVQIFGLPSLRPDMYQENLLRARHAAEAVGSDASDPENYRFAPANDPFVLASVVSEIVREHRKDYPSANVYLSPLSTKAHALGMGLYFLTECAASPSPTSVIYPIFRKHERQTSDGVSALWRFKIELQ
jgi:hypothetical protein